MIARSFTLLEGIELFIVSLMAVLSGLGVWTLMHRHRL